MNSAKTGPLVAGLRSRESPIAAKGVVRFVCLNYRIRPGAAIQDQGLKSVSKSVPDLEIIRFFSMAP